MAMPNVIVRDVGSVRVVEMNRPETRNAVDEPTARALTDAFEAFDSDDEMAVAVLSGAGGTFCAGADLHSIARGGMLHRLGESGESPLGPGRLRLSKPVIAAIEGYAVAGGLELAIWCDLRVAARDAVLGVFCRRFGVPLVDMGTIRLPRLIGHGRAMDLILTGRGVDAEEAMGMGLVNRVCEPGEALESAIELATQLASFPQTCMRNDRLAAIEQWDLTTDDATANEARFGLTTLRSGEPETGAREFGAGLGRHGLSVERP